MFGIRARTVDSKWDLSKKKKERKKAKKISEKDF